MCFDDSKTHYAENSSDSDRVVLIVDIIRPNNIQTGKSDVTDSKELLEIIDYFRKINV
jgi:aspartyl/asparaginyl beta-hydroxylase (cupin superfamily)